LEEARSGPSKRYLFTEEAERLRQQGAGLDEILRHLRARGCSRGLSVAIVAGLHEYGPSRFAHAMAATGSESTAPDWLLVMGDLRLGALWLSDVDQPWYYCLFKPTPAFETIRPLFDAVNEALRASEFNRAAELLDEVASKGVCLIWGDGQARPRPDMAGSIQLNGHQIMFRPDNVRLQGGKPIPQID
jgi:hypothetical protein